MARRAAPVKSQDVVDVTIERLAQGGRGVARHEGFVLFVQRGMPGDTVRARVTRVKRSFAEAVAESVLQRGPDSVDAPCPYFGACGGCAWQSLDYHAQLDAKQDQVRDCVVRLGGIAEPPLRPIVPATDQWGYRNKVEYTFVQLVDGAVEATAEAIADGSQGEPDVVPSPSGVGAGFHAAGRWDQVIPVDPCLIADPRGIPAHRAVVAWANRHDLAVYDREEATGLLRSLVVRVGRNTGEVMVHLVTGPGKLPRQAELVDDLEAEVPGLVSVLRSVNSSSAEVAFADEGNEPELLWGREWFEELLGGERLRVRAGSFLQTNTQMADRLYEIVREVAVLREDDIVYDLYCGIGSIGLMLARHVRQVVGVEVVQQAIDCAAENAELNGLDNVEFQVGNVRPILKFAKGVWPDPSLVVVDPPRSGLVQKVVRRICEARPDRVVYVSCNPATFAGNLPWFRENGYEPTFIQAVDQFPHTHHVELVARLDPIPGWEPPAGDAETASVGQVDAPVDPAEPGEPDDPAAPHLDAPADAHDLPPG